MDNLLGGGQLISINDVILNNILTFNCQEKTIKMKKIKDFGRKEKVGCGFQNTYKLLKELSLQLS
jgi:hypothetical protein